MDNYKLRFIAIGGIVDVTKNMYVYELWKGDEIADILIVDCGIGFPKEKDLGVDFVIPDASYLHDKRDKIRAVVFTHGHEDHISALRFHWEELGRPPIYGSKLTALLCEAKFKEYGQNIHINQIQYRQDYKLGAFTVRHIRMTHSIPDTTHVLIKTPAGTFYHGSDFKLDLTPPFSEPPDFYEIAKAGEDGVTCLLSDCLGVEREGMTLSENIVGKTFEDEIRSTKGRFVMTTFSSNISRIRQCVEAAVKFNRGVVFMGRSMRDNTELAKKIGYLPINQRFLIDETQIKRTPPNKLCIIAAGSQGQFGSALSKLASGENRFIKLEKGDKVLFSSDPIPGQEDDVYDVIEQLYSLGITVVYSDIAEQLHASGHGSREDLKFLVRLVRPQHLLPIGGTIRHQQQYREMARELGYKDEQVSLLSEGDTVIFDKGKVIPGAQVETKTIFVDAYGVGDVGNVILRDRKTLAQEGVVFVVLIIDSHFQMVRPPEFVSRGFIFKTDEKQIFVQAQRLIEKKLKSKEGRVYNDSEAKQEIIKALENYFLDSTGRKPLVGVEIVQV